MNWGFLWAGACLKGTQPPRVSSPQHPNAGAPERAKAHPRTVTLGLGRLVTSNSFVAPWTAARQAPVSMGFPRQEHCRGLPFPSGDLPDPGTEPKIPGAPALVTPHR